MASKNGALEALRKREAEIKARIADLEAKEKGKKRKEENRLKILVGAAIIADTEKHPETRAERIEVLNRAITNDKDRAFMKGLGWL